MGKRAGALLVAAGLLVGGVTVPSSPVGAAQGAGGGVLTIQIDFTSGAIPLTGLTPASYAFDGDVTGVAAIGEVVGAYAGPVFGTVSGNGSSNIASGGGTVNGAFGYAVGLLISGGASFSGNYTHVGTVLVVTGSATFSGCLTTMVCPPVNGSFSYVGLIAATSFVVPTLTVDAFRTAGAFALAGV